MDDGRDADRVLGNAAVSSVTAGWCNAAEEMAESQVAPMTGGVVAVPLSRERGLYA